MTDRKEDIYSQVITAFCDKIKAEIESGSNPVYVISIKNLKEQIVEFASETFGIEDSSIIRRMTLTDDIISSLYPLDAKRYTDWEYQYDDDGSKKVKTILSLKIVVPPNYQELKSIGERGAGIDGCNNDDVESSDKYVWVENEKKYNWKDVLKLADDAKSMLQTVRNDKYEISKSISSDQPILVIFSADWHFGAAGVDYSMLAKDMDIIMNNKNVYLVIVGDELENMNPSFKNRLPSSEQILPRELEIAFYKSLMKDLTDNNKIIAACWGNHDAEFDERTIGYAVKRYVVDNSDIFLPYGGFVNIDVNDIKYRFRVSHSYNGYSIYNPNHSNLRSLKEKGLVNLDQNLLQGVDGDVQAHGHIPAFQYLPFASGHVILIKTGTYLKQNAYGARYFPSVDGLRFPCVLLYPDKHILVPIMGVDIAIDILNKINRV